MKKFGELLLVIISMAIGAAAVKYGISEYRLYKSNNIVTEVTNKLDNTVANDNTNRTDSEKIYDAAQDMMSERLDNISPDKASKKDKEFSAGVFAGQYGRLVIVTFNYCKTLGVDISEFSNSYKNTHKNIYIKANLILKNSGSSVEEIYKSSESIVHKYVVKEVSDIKAMLSNQNGDNNITLADACNYFNLIAQDKEAMKSVMFSNVAPEPYKILMN